MSFRLFRDKSTNRKWMNFFRILTSVTSLWDGIKYVNVVSVSASTWLITRLPRASTTFGVGAGKSYICRRVKGLFYETQNLTKSTTDVYRLVGR